MKVQSMLFNPFGEMTYVLWHEDGKDAIVIDPGMMHPSEKEVFSSFIEQHHLNIIKVVLTHVHIDHAIATTWVASNYNANIEFNDKDIMLLSRLNEQAAMFGLNITVDDFVATRNLKDGDMLDLNGESIQVLETPGHSQGSICLYAPQSNKLISGDTLFAGSIGRCDLPGGNFDQIIESIKTKLISLPAETVVYPGHGDCTTIAEEKRYNPYVRG